MTVFEWLVRNAPGFEVLSDDERTAITEFSLLWSLFEAKSLNEHGSANAILESARLWAEADLLTEHSFSRELAYFRDRYVANGEYTHHFHHLHLRENDAPDLVKQVLRHENASLEDIAAAVLIIVYRYRNNLFHGRKWSYELQGQLNNFRCANSALMQAIELHDLWSLMDT